MSYKVKFTMSEVMQTSDGPTNPRTWRVVNNRQMNSGSFTSHTVSKRANLIQMSDRPTHSSHTFFLKVFRIIVTHYFLISWDLG